MHSEEGGSRVSRQFCISLGNVEQSPILVADYYVAQLPVDRRAFSALRLELAIAFHRNAVTAEPERACNTPPRHIFVDAVFRRGDPGGGFLSDRLAQEIGVAQK